MKKYIHFAIFLVMTTNLFSQSTKNKQPIPDNYFLQKSRNQRDLGYVLLGVGTAAFITPFLVWQLQEYPSEFDLEGIGVASIFVGAGMMIGSVPLFIASRNNKRKGMSLSFQNETAPFFQDGILLSGRVPSLSIKIGL